MARLSDKPRSAIWRGLSAFILAGAILAAPAMGQDPDVHIVGTVSTKPLLLGIVEAMKEEKNLHVVVDAQVTSAQALDALAAERVDIALITRPITGEERATYPEADFLAIPVGMQVVAIAVSNDLWDAGVHSISQETMRGIYERKITNWKQAGGPDEKVSLFNLEQGQGVWEIFADWLYGDNRKAPIPKVEKVSTSEDVRDLLEFTPGSISPIAAVFADGSRCHALSVRVNQRLVDPSPDQVAARRYPMVRPIFAVVLGRPSLGTRAITEYLTGPEGQALLKKTGDLGLDAAPKPPVDPNY